MTWRWELSRRAERQLFAIPLDDRRRVLDALDRLAVDPRTVDARKLQGRENEYRLRVGDWRVRFRYDKLRQIIAVTEVLRRNEGTYRD